MNDFLHSHKLLISTLSPVHIGCGEDFEPTNYFIDDDVLYHFDPADAALPERKTARLIELCNSGKPDEMVLEVQRFFFDNRAHFLPCARALIPVAAEVATHYRLRVGQAAQRESNGKKVANLLEVERTSYNPHSNEPILPGSSLKGAMRTAILDAINNGHSLTNGETARAMEKRLLQGDFAADPLRLLKISDTLLQADIVRKIVFCVNLKKRQVDGQEIKSKALTTRKEVIMQGQYRALRTDLTLHDLQDRKQGKDVPAPHLRPTDLRSIARDCNRYYENLLLQELDVLEKRRFVTDAWATWIRQALAGELRAGLDRGDAFLLRVGRYTSAEAKTLEGVRRIHIPQAKMKKDQYVATAHTVWLAADKAQARSDMLPFGWLLIEIDPKDDLPHLRESLAIQARNHHPDMQAVRARFIAERSAAAEKMAQASLERAQAEADAQAALAAEAAQAAQRAAMSPNIRAITDLQKMLEQAVRQKQPGGRAFDETFAALRAALEPTWSAAERKELADRASPLLKEKNMLIGKCEKEFKSLLRQLRGEAG
jgi:CRISPR-associated protein Csm5